jgi:hypothetical protein
MQFQIDGVGSTHVPTVVSLYTEISYRDCRCYQLIVIQEERQGGKCTRRDQQLQEAVNPDPNLH